jgi:hypothetical protein
MSLGRAYLDALMARQAAIEAEAKALDAERERYVAQATTFDEQVERNRRELAGYLVPDIDDESLLALETRFHYPSLVAQKRPYVEVIAAAESARLTLEADPAFVGREVTRLENQGTLADIGPALADVRQHKAPWDAEHRHAKLVNAGFYGDGPSSLWRRFTFWRQGSLLMAALERRGLPRFSDLEDLRARWLKIASEHDPLARAEADANAALASVVALEARHAQLLAEPARQFQLCFEALGRALVDHLLALPEDSLVEFARQDPSLNSFLKKHAGLKKQATYLRELAQVRLAPAVANLRAEANKTHDKARRTSAKLSRGKRIAVTQADIAKTRQVPADKWDKRRQSTARMRERIGTYHDYDRGSFLTTYLWWDAMTRGAPGDDLYEVKTFHAANPDWTPDAFVDPAASALTAHESYRDDAASAFADQLMSDSPDQSLFDAS